MAGGWRRTSVTSDYVWIYDLDRGEGRKLPIGERSGWPVWHPDNETVSFRAWKELSNESRVVSVRLGGSSAPQELVATETAPAAPYSWSADGTVLAVSTLATDRSIAFIKPGTSPQRPGKGAYAGHMPTFSPDGRWVAYNSIETGQNEIFVRSYPDSRVVGQISVGGGIEPLWCPCGELFYRNGNRWLSVRTRTGKDLQWDAPQPRFETDFIDTLGRSYDISPDGKRLLVVKRAEPDIRNRIELVLNWTGVLSR